MINRKSLKVAERLHQAHQERKIRLTYADSVMYRMRKGEVEVVWFFDTGLIVRNGEVYPGAGYRDIINALKEQ